MLFRSQVDGQRVLTYWEAILQEKLPASAIIIGAGAIGAEFATIWSSYGTQVTMVEMLPRLLPLEDEEISVELGKAFQKRGIRVLTGTRVQKVETTESGVRVTVREGETDQVLEAEQALVAIGFKPNTSDLGLEALGVQLTERKFVQDRKSVV